MDDNEYFGESAYGKSKMYDFDSDHRLRFDDILSFLQGYYEKVLSLHRKEIESDELWHVVFWQRVMLGSGFPPSRWPQWFVDNVCRNAFPEWKPLVGQYGNELGKAKQKALDYGTLLLYEIVRHPILGKKYKPDVKLKGEGNSAQALVAELLGLTTDGVNKICQRARKDFDGRPLTLDMIHLSGHPIAAVLEASRK
ncbi:MAG: hypothetical protein IID61_11315 [SAR324 cluster bacterium]|nr:hypothetical protein [SAR324 cluster bacterium]